MGAKEDINLLEKSLREMQERGEDDLDLIATFQSYLNYIKENGYGEFVLNNKQFSQGKVNGFVRRLNKKDLKKIERISKIEYYGYSG